MVVFLVLCIYEERVWNMQMSISREELIRRQQLAHAHNLAMQRQFGGWHQVFTSDAKLREEMQQQIKEEVEQMRKQFKKEYDEQLAGINLQIDKINASYTQLETSHTELQKEFQESHQQLLSANNESSILIKKNTDRLQMHEAGYSQVQQEIQQLRAQISSSHSLTPTAPPLATTLARVLPQHRMIFAPRH